MADGSSNKIVKLGEDNYQYWAFQMRNYLESKDLWRFIDQVGPAHPGERPASGADGGDIDGEAFVILLQEFNDWQSGSRRALNYVAMNIDRSNANVVYSAVDGREAWAMLRERHMTASLGNILRTRKRITEVKLAAGQTIQEHFNLMDELFNRMADLGSVMPEPERITHIINSVEGQFPAASAAIMGWSADRLNAYAIRQHLIEEFERRKAVERKDNGVTSLQRQVRQEIQREEGFYGGPSGNRRQDGDMNERYDRGGARRQRRGCFVCGSNDHWKRDCPMRNKFDLREKLNSLNKNAKQGEEYLSCVTINELKRHEWIVDSGSTSHMTWKLDHFSDVREHFGKIRVANKQFVAVKGIGTVKVNVKLTDGRTCVMVLRDVLWAPGLGESLLSVRKLVQDGASIRFDQNKVYLQEGNVEKEIGDVSNSHYRLMQDDKNDKENEKSLSMVTNHNQLYKCVHEWHRVLGHRNLQDVRRMGAQGLNIKKCECSDVCEPCVFGKMSRRPFPKKSQPVNEVMDVVVSDVCGFMQKESISGKRYFITFIDVKSRYCEVKFLRRKNEAVQESINYIERMKTQLQRKPRTFRSDRGTEYLDKNCKIISQWKG